MTPTEADISLLIRLFIAHMISDYFLQSSAWTVDKLHRKIRSPKLYLHILITFLTAWVLSGSLKGALLIGITHYIIDLGKIYLKYNRFVLFLLDQALHTLMLFVTWLWLISGWEWLWIQAGAMLQGPSFWLMIFAYGVISFPLSIVIDIFIRKWREELAAEKQSSLQQAGQWIGIMERVLVLTFVLIGQFSAIGFLIATKAILRFKDTETRQMEYVLVGTLMSLTPTILLGILSQKLLTYF